MKSILIKFGKGLSAMRRDGIWNGGKRSVAAFFKLFQRVGSGDILFISSGVGDSARYRSHNQAEELRLHGFKCSITVQDNPLLPKYADRFKIFIFQKVLYTRTVSKMIERIKEAGGEIIFGTDDLVYDPSFLKHMDYYKKISVLEKPLYENGLGGEILRDPYVKTAVTTTSFLADKLRSEGKQIFISKNKLSLHDLEIVERIMGQMKTKDGDDEVIISYFSGTASHDKDFATITEPLVDSMRRYPQVKLHLYGPLQIDERFNEFGERVRQFPFVPREKHLENNANSDIVLAPLEIGNPFCESKSELKYFEAGIFGVPIVATATRTFSDAIEDGVDGFVAANPDEWKEKLEKLILNKNMRDDMGAKARAKALAEYTNQNSHNEEYYRYLKSKLEDRKPAGLDENQT